MSFEEFVSAIEADPLKRVAHFWNLARGARRMPGWRDLSPSKITSQLPIIWSWKYDPARDDFTGRLAGDAIETVFGKSFRGARMDEIFMPKQLPLVFARHRRVVSQPCFFRGCGVVFGHLDRYGVGERIIMPLSETGGACDGLLGATVYETDSGPAELAQADVGEIEEWFALG